MFQELPVARYLRLAFGGGLTGVALMAAPAFAQTAGSPEVQTGERVEVTGSSIKRIGAETALPVITLTAEDIKKSGFTSATDLIQSLPSNQGFLTASQSINGGGGGAATASLHSIGSQYTLVLLNGRRLAPFTTGTTVNLNEIPLSAIERVEILLDGASALYGADAIAGVVNFITKKNSSDGTLTGQATIPQKQGARSGVVSLSKGIGDVEVDRFNLFGSLSFEKQTKLDSVQRDFSKTGIIPFSDNGRNLVTFDTSSNSIPGTAYLYSRAGAQIAAFTPAYLTTGSCGPKTVLRSGICRFDLASTVEDLPAYRRSSFFGSGQFKVSEALTFFGEAGVSDFRTQARFAPPAQPGIFLTQAVVNADIVPLLPRLGLTPASYAPVGDPNFYGPTTNLRVYDAGGRQDEFRYFSQNYVVGAEGSIKKLDYSTYFTHSQTQFTDTFQSGYLSSIKFNSLISSGAFDPLTAQIGQSGAVLAPAVLHQKFDQSRSTLDIVHAQGALPIFALPGGDFQIAGGAEGGRQKYSDSPSAIAQGNNSLQPNYFDTPIGGSSGSLPFDSTRKNVGAFVELVAPVVKSVEVTGSVRHDRYSKVTNDENFNGAGILIGPGSQGKQASATTYKLGARWQPVNELLFRGSIGTGFKAPDLSAITSPVAAFGNTGFEGCPPGLAAALALRCQPTPAEYNERRGGNAASDASGLDPETSKQFTLGFRVEPTSSVSFGVDLWSVKLKKRIDYLPESVAFSDGITFGSAFSVLPDPVTGAPTLTFTQTPSNLGKARYKGLDFDGAARFKTPIGTLTTKGTYTYMIKADYEVAGLPGYQSDLGKIGVDTQVTFRWLLNASASLASGPFTNTLNVRVKPTYHDEVAMADGSSANTVRVVNSNGTYGATATVARDVGSYVVWDYQGRYQVAKALGVSFGVRNLFNRNPPLTIQQEAGTGNFQGYDGRYTDPVGRAFYLAADAHF